MNALLSPECTRPNGGTHVQCTGATRVAPGLVSVCLCACHHAAPTAPTEPASRERNERMLADWANGLFRLRDLARRYGVGPDVPKAVIWERRRKV